MILFSVFSSMDFPSFRLIFKNVDLKDFTSADICWRKPTVHLPKTFDYLEKREEEDGFGGKGKET